MKIYDKEMYARNESVKSAIVIILTFMLGFVAGCLVANFDTRNKMEQKDGYITDLDKTIQEQDNLINEQNTNLNVNTSDPATNVSTSINASVNANSEATTSTEATPDAQ